MKRLGILLLGLLSSLGAWAASPCSMERLDPMPHIGWLEDPGATLTAQQVQTMPMADFDDAAAHDLAERYSHSAFWMRFELSNDTAQSCQRWLTVGAPRLQDVQVYVWQQAAWHRQVAGSVHPLEEWAVPQRQPMFPLNLESGEQISVLVRVSTPSMLLLSPVVWSELALLQAHQRTNLVDGLVLGIVLLVVPFSLILGWIMRSRLLAIHAVVLLCYLAYVCVVNGYLVFWPSLLPWTNQIGALFSSLLLIFLAAYLQVLMQVSRLPSIWGWLFNLLACSFLVGQLWGLLFDSVQGRLHIELSMQLMIYLLLPVVMFVGVRRGLSYHWLAWLVTTLYMVQFFVRYVVPMEQLPWQSRQSIYDLSSILPGVLLLVCTLIMEANRSRSRERQALDDLDGQQQAEHERLESTVARRTKQLRDSLRARSTLLARISHDLRSPLVSIIDYARLLRVETPLDYPVKIERNARQQLEMIDELLEFSRSELQQLELVLAPGYLYGFLREVEDEGGFLAQRQANRFTCHFAADLPLLVRADFRRLRQVLNNLLANAAKFTKNGQIEFAVDCLARNEQSAQLRFVVSDTGIGIPPEERKYLLQPFRRGSNAARYDGTGLGLSIVTQWLQQMGSDLQVEGGAEAGSRFVFHLDLPYAHEHELDVLVDEAQALQTEGAGRSILLVDDVERNREVMSDLLAGYDFDVQVAAGGREAMRVLSEQTVDLLVTDQVMPGVNGWALLAHARNCRPQMPVLLYSAGPPLRPSDVAADLYFDAAVLKPAGSAELIEHIERLLEQPA